MLSVARPTFIFASAGTVTPLVSTVYTPARIRTAYGLSDLSFGSTAANGAGQTIAIIDAYNAPTLAFDLQSFDNMYGLSNPTLTVEGQTGSTTSLPANAPNQGNSWAVETSLDVEWAHSIAPAANILVVEANSATSTDLYAAVDTARHTSGVSVVSMSFGTNEVANETAAYDSHFTTPSGHAGVTFIASSGDSGAYSGSNNSIVAVGYPAASANVIGVGGTSLTTNSSGGYSTESGWGDGANSGTDGGSGGGLSQYVSQPAYQGGVVTQSSTARAVPDVSIDGDPNTGVVVIDSYDVGNSNPVEVGGTSLSAPMWAGIVTLADQDRALNGMSSMDGRSQTLPQIYSLPGSDFHDITSGSNGYSAGSGYDLITGRGTPIADLLIPDLADVTYTTTNSSTSPTPTIGSLSATPSSVSAGASTVVTLTASNVAESGGMVTAVEFYRGSSFIGSGTASGSTWTLSMNTASLSAGSYSFSAIATDGATSSSPASTTLTVTAATTPVPIVGSLSCNHSSVVANSSTSITLTAANVTETGGTVTEVEFYHGSAFLGAGTPSGSTWTFITSVTSLPIGMNIFSAIATDGQNTSASVSASVVVVARAAPLVTTGELLGWNVNKQSKFGTQNLTATTIATGLSNQSKLARGSGVRKTGTAPPSTWGGTSWAKTAAAGIKSGAYITFGFYVGVRQTLGLAGINLNYRRTATGPISGLWQYRLGTGDWTTIATVANEFAKSSTSSTAMPSLNTTRIKALQAITAGTAVGFRLVPFGGSNASGAFYIADRSGDDLKLNGTLTNANANGSEFGSTPAIQMGPASAPAFSDKRIGDADLTALLT